MISSNIHSSIRRVNALNRILQCRAINTNKLTLSIKYYSSNVSMNKTSASDSNKVESSDVMQITIGDITRTSKPVKHKENIPSQYLNKDNLTQDQLAHLRWILQKDNLRQDVFLIGKPGSLRRTLAMSYLELTQREVEYICLSRDTTEADIKQRREIVNGTAKYYDQSAVRAAIEGRVLILEGIEKAERNVLPVLNNLLENREMHLEDGRFLVSADTYDKLLREHGESELSKWNLVRVSEEFRVLALGLPVPPYVGNPLDPPLRSRFQARNIPSPTYQDTLSLLTQQFPNVNRDSLTKLVSVAYALVSEESRSVALPDFPIDNLTRAVQILSDCPRFPVVSLISSLYPYNSFVSKEARSLVESIMQSLGVSTDVKLEESMETDQQASSTATSSSQYIPTSYQNSLLSALLTIHPTSDVCLVGPRGCGKTTLVKEYARRLNVTVEPIALYQDMTARDLLQQRSTKQDGDTVWQNSTLVSAALEGSLAVCDGLHRVHASTLCVLQRLVHDRELQLYDGTRLLRHDRYDTLVESNQGQPIPGVLRIHPDFRIIATAESPSTGNSWLTPEILSLFLFQEVRNLNINEEAHLIQSMYGSIPSGLNKLLSVIETLRESNDPALVQLSSSLSTRQLLRIARRMYQFPGQQDLWENIQGACLAKFLPPLIRHSFFSLLTKHHIAPSPPQSSLSPPSISTADPNSVLIGSTRLDKYRTRDSQSKIPSVLFYDVPQHVQLLERIGQDFSLGEHLLLVGNQGVGKNKITDKLLQLLGRPRDYIQLHRDTTVQSLTVQPVVVEGKVAYNDSPLVQAVKAGHVLVVDEADKAPTHVVCILKTLVESGEMILSDGRRIVPSTDPRVGAPNIIPAHPEFRLIVLANRPGFPFLGNDLFSALGDLFSVHVIDNPSEQSELVLLSSYGPDVPRDTLLRLVRAFGQFRELSDKALLPYPYSTREAVHIVKHLQNYPNDSMSEAVSNVFDFDKYNSAAKETLLKILNEHGIPVNLSHTLLEKKDKPLQLTVQRDSGLDTSEPKHGKEDPNNDPHVGGNTWAGGTGGRDTAGLGGKGGPYRLDKGHTVHQISEAEKSAIPEHVKKAAREMGEKAFREKLKEIQMSQYDAKVYNEYSLPVQNQVQALRIILSSLQAKSQERVWSRNQTSGDLDDARLIEGITGERAIYKRRSDQDPELGTPQMKPKRLRLVVDVSGSMYRFNGYDARLDREMEAVIMVLEAFQDFDQRICLDIVGHSGDTPCIPFVPMNHLPRDNKQRLDVIKTMHAHSQFCVSGDYTVESIADSVDSLAGSSKDYDDSIVIVLSDANLERYGIHPRELAAAMDSDSGVRAYAVFIGSLGDQAKRLTEELPPGRGFVCMDLSEIPQILQQIFSTSLLK
uniref:von Willebrand factor A domain-containing protein 8 n=1 Tax=Cacopsylla melanoneura TaxID=428564 RepID=A0A8D9DUC4_9HEMI